MRGLARAVVGLLQTGVDFTCRLSHFTARRHDGGPSAATSGFGIARNDHYYAARGQLDAAAKRRHELDATRIAAGGYEYATEISGVFKPGGR